jgi:Flp pilus assembly protein TadD
MMRIFNFKRTYCSVILLTISSISVGNGEETNQKNIAIHHFMQGEFLLNQGNYALAVLEFQDALSIDPNASTIHVSIADAYRRLGRSKHAEDHLRISIDLDPEELSSREMLGHLYLINRRYSEAEKEFLVLANLDLFNDKYITILGDLAKLQERWVESVDYYLKAYEVNPQNFKSLENALQVCLGAELFKRAESICLSLAMAESNNESYWQTYKQITAYNKHYEKTLLAILEIERINGLSIKTLMEKSSIKQEQNKNDEAIKYLLNAFELDKMNIEIIQRLVSIYLDDENFNEAEFYNDILLKEFSNDPSGFINASIISLNNSLPQKAIDYLQPNIEKFTNNYSAHYILGTSYYQVDDLINSEKHLIKALSIFPGSRNSKHTLAMIYDQNGSWMKSDSLYLDLISTDSTDAQAYNNFSYSLVERNDNLELALEMSIIANRLQPKSAPYLDTLGWIYFRLEQYEKALEYVQESYSVDNTNPVILEHLADILKATDQISKANLIYMQAIDIGGDSLLIQRKINIE